MVFILNRLYVGNILIEEVLKMILEGDEDNRGIFSDNYSNLDKKFKSWSNFLIESK